MGTSRSNRAVLAQQTLKILNQGGYTLNGRNVAVSIDQAENGTRIFKPEELEKLLAAPNASEANTNTATIISVANETTFHAAGRLIKTHGDSVCCLNFASAKNPGGGFLNGSQAQEEALARASGLYPCLLKAEDYYIINRTFGTALYTDHMIYSPEVPVFRDDDDALLSTPFSTAIITAPAPNAGAVKQNEPQRADEIPDVMKRRCGYVLAIARAMEQKHLVLGAWGCGVFRNNPHMVAQCFAEWLSSSKFAPAFESVHFAVLDHTREQNTLNAFRASLN